MRLSLEDAAVELGISIKALKRLLDDEEITAQRDPVDRRKRVLTSEDVTHLLERYNLDIQRESDHDMSATIASLQAWIASLQGSVTDLSQRVKALEADRSSEQKTTAAPSKASPRARQSSAESGQLHGFAPMGGVAPTAQSSRVFTNSGRTPMRTASSTMKSKGAKPEQ